MPQRLLSVLLGIWGAACGPLVQAQQVPRVLPDVPEVLAEPFDPMSASMDDQQRAEQGLLPLYARFVEVHAGSAFTGHWKDLPDGQGRLWQQRLRSPGAQATELFLEDVHLPAGAYLHVHDVAGEQVHGPYTAADVTVDGGLTTAMVVGEESVISYHEPGSVRGQGRLSIHKLAHAYALSEAELGGNCHVDVNCPEGADWVPQRDAVVRIRVVISQGTGWCTGTLMNNTEEDCTPYILSALHCTEESSAGHFAQYQFRFNFQRDGCGTGTSPIQVMTGCTRVADSNDQGGDLGSDFVLLLLNDEIPEGYNAFFAGWDATNTASSSGVGLHHPGGNEKRISTYTTELTTTQWWLGNGSHWQVNWSATENGHGVTEGGSSGSPLFNSVGRVVGTLTGGLSCCTVGGCGQNTGPNAPDKYGKMSYHWTNNPNITSQKLRAFLSPGPNLTTFDGRYDPCGLNGVTEQMAPASPVIMPNPARGMFNVVWAIPPGPGAWVEVMDASGRVVHHERMKDRDRIEMDASNWAQGLYLVRTAGEEGMQPAVRLSVW